MVLLVRCFTRCLVVNSNPNFFRCLLIVEIERRTTCRTSIWQCTCRDRQPTTTVFAFQLFSGGSLSSCYACMRAQVRSSPPPCTLSVGKEVRFGRTRIPLPMKRDHATTSAPKRPTSRMCVGIGIDSLPGFEVSTKQPGVSDLTILQHRKTLTKPYAIGTTVTTIGRKHAAKTSSNSQHTARDSTLLSKSRNCSLL